MASRSRMQEYWDSEAHRYDRVTAWAERRWLRHARAWVGERARGDVLEVAVGTGATLPYYGSDCRVTAVDWSERMLDHARVRASQEALEVDLRRVDALSLPFDDASFDTGVCTYALCCVPDDQAVLSEMVRVLRPGGSLLLTDHVVSTNPLLRAVLRVAEAGTVRAFGEHFTRRPVSHLDELPVTVVETTRSTAGMLERVHARRV